MKTTDKTIINRISYLLNLAEETSKTHTIGTPSVDCQKFSELFSASLSFIENLFGKNHPYYKQLTLIYAEGTGIYSVSCIKGVLNSIKTEIDNNWLDNVRVLISAEIFTDFLEMAEYLLQESYKDPAAVIVGSVLEEHLRKLCLKNNIPVEIIKSGKTVAKKADLLNSELTKSEIYNKLTQKNITAWLDLRNNAAHGKYNEYTKEQVTLMYQGVLNFVSIYL